MPPQWTEPLSISVLWETNSSSSSPLTSPTFDPQPQLHCQLHQVSTTSSADEAVNPVEKPFRPNISREEHHRPVMARLPRLLQRSSNTSRPQPILRLNRLHPPVPSDLSSFAPPVKSEFLRVSTVASSRYATPPDPVDDHDHSLFEFPSVILRDKYQQESPSSTPIQEPRRRNIHHLIEHYNSRCASNSAPPDPRSPVLSARSPDPSKDPDKHPYHFDIQSVRDIFERHAQRLPDQEASLSSVTNSAGPSDASHQRLFNQPNARTDTPPDDNRPRRIAFADLSNTLDLSPCASSTSDCDPDDRQVPAVTPPSRFRSSTLRSSRDVPRRFGRKKSLAIFGSAKRDYADKARSWSFANGETYPSHSSRQSKSRRFTNAESPKRGWVTKQVRAYGASARRRLESFRNMISTSDD